MRASSWTQAEVKATAWISASRRRKSQVEKVNVAPAAGAADETPTGDGDAGAGGGAGDDGGGPEVESGADTRGRAVWPGERNDSERRWGNAWGGQNAGGRSDAAGEGREAEGGAR
jgi:hypothetical protein